MHEIPAEDVCFRCQQSLNDSVITENDGEVFKEALHVPARQALMFSVNMISLVCEIRVMVD